MKKFLLSIFAVMLAVFSVQAEEVTFTAVGAGNVGTSNTGGEVVLENGAVKVVLSKAYGDGTQFRIYSGCSLTVTGTNVTITGVEFTAYDGKTGAIILKSGGGNITSSGSVRSWAGSSNEIVLSASAQIRTQSITVTYTTGDSGEGEGGGETPGNPEGGETIEGGTATFNASDTYSADTSVDGVEIALGDYVTATFSKADGSTAPKYFANGTSIRWYSKNTLVIESTAGSITGITFGFGSGDSSNAIKANVGTYSNGTWTGSANSVTFTVDGTSGNRRISSISVTYAGKQEGEPVVEDVVMPVISPAETDYNVGEIIEVEITTTTENATIYYTTDGTEPNTNSLVYSSPIEVSSTTTIKAYAVKDGCNDSPKAEKTFTFRRIVTLNNCTVAELIEAYASGDDIADDATVVGYIVGCVDGNALSKAVFGNEVSTKSNILLADDPYETNIDNCIPVQLPSGDVRTALNLADNSDNYQKKVILTGDVEAYFNVAGLKNTSAYEFVDEISHTLTVTEAGYATLFLGASARIPSTIEAYTVTAVNNGWVTLTQVTGVIPANTGIIVKADAGNYEFFLGETATADVTGNLLSGSTYNNNIEEEAYVLGNVNGVVGLYKAEKNQMDGTAWLNNANKAYLPASEVPAAVQGAASFSFRFGEGTTGVDQITDNREQSTAIYDLTGRRVENPSNGIYIINGVKVLVK